MSQTLFITNKVIAAYAEAMLNLLNEEGMDFINVRNCHETIKRLLSGISAKNIYFKDLTRARRKSSLFLSAASIDEEDWTDKDGEIIANYFNDVKSSLSNILNMSGINYWKAFAAEIQDIFDERGDDVDVEEMDIRIATLEEELKAFRDDAEELAELEEQLEEFQQRLEEIENNEF